MLDVVVVFYTMACLGSDIFELAFQTLVNEVLPQMGRPYAVYRFSLDAEPRFVSEMAESLGLPERNPVISQGFAWSGPGRPLFIIGDQALESRGAFSRFMRQSQLIQQTPHAAESGERRRDIAERERWPRSQSRLLGGRAVAILAWCLFATAALGAVVVGVEPQWARSLLHSTTSSGPGGAPKGPLQGSDAQTGAIPPADSLDNSAGVTLGSEPQASVNSNTRSRPVHTQARKKRATHPWNSYQSYGGMPDDPLR